MVFHIAVPVPEGIDVDVFGPEVVITLRYLRRESQDDAVEASQELLGAVIEKRKESEKP